MILTIIVLVILGAIHAIREWRAGRDIDDGLGPIIGRATIYENCPNCGHRDGQTPRGRGEVITRGGAFVVRQYHLCDNCGTKVLWHRRLDRWVWTINRSGVER